MSVCDFCARLDDDRAVRVREVCQRHIVMRDNLRRRKCVGISGRVPVRNENDVVPFTDRAPASSVHTVFGLHASDDESLDPKSVQLAGAIAGWICQPGAPGFIGA